MISRSEYLNRLVFQRRSNGGKGTFPKIQLHNFPVGSEIFEIVVKFCYGWKVDLTASNIAPVHCAAHFLEMSNYLEQGNLISKTEAFLSLVLLWAWEDIFWILKSCESISLWAKKLQVVKWCSDAIAWNACIDPKLFKCGSFALFPPALYVSMVHFVDYVGYYLKILSWSVIAHKWVVLCLCWVCCWFLLVD